jgi:RIO kinase 1
MNLNYYQEPDEIEDFRDDKPRHLGSRKKVNRPISRKIAVESTDGQGSTDDASYPFTYHASRHEKQWLMASIKQFHQEDWIEDILKMVRGGKEASVYLCTRPTGSNPQWIAAKVYRPRRFRNLKNDQLYREGRDQLDTSGRVIHDDRSLHAMRKRTTYGRELLHSSWIGHEYHTMQLLADAGVDLPRPYASSENAILMDFIGDEFVSAPTLNTVSLGITEAQQLFKRVMYNIELMLRFNRIHADLSAYNIVYWQGGIKLIDFPQAIHPDENRNAYRIFARDVEKVCAYFASQGVDDDPVRLARGMWQARGRLVETPLDPAYLDPEKEEDRRAWNRQ